VQRIASNVAGIRQRMADAAQRSGRDAADVTLVAVTKYVGLPETQMLLDAGCCDLGESRPQGLWAKAEAFVDAELRWHMIGHLQRNKVRRTLPVVCLTHSGDSVRLIAEIDRLAEAGDGPAKILLEVNISGDESKHGFEADELEAALPQLAALPNVAIRGLMAMARLDGDLSAARRDFSALRELRDRLLKNCPEQVGLDELSMGMSRDFEVAIEEGATLIRVGSALFEGVQD
jgi:pyridoxal phosphate enzyme (YggS family)